MKRIALTLSFLVCLGTAAVAEQRTVYASYILHGNMNYDRYIRPTIWKEFPRIYDGLLDFMDEHPDFRGQLQFSGQTLGSLLQAAPEVAEHARKIHERGQLNLTGTFYSEPVNVNMNGETNYRCAWLGTQLIEKFLGEATDGFYLQERAYHPQLPWILKHSGVSWTPIITGDDSWRPFLLQGMDGTESVCVPITRGNLVERARLAPDKSLLTIEEDYEIPQSFTNTYAQATHFNETNDSVSIEWITVKEYIERFGTDTLRYIDHSAKAQHKENGTYSRWTADPLDIITQDYTNHAMADYRSAQMFSRLLYMLTGKQTDISYDEWDGQISEEPLAWDIERADLYPDVEPDFLRRSGEVTLLSKAEHLLLWGVNSDAKGWYPLYEKRRERQNSFLNCSRICRDIIDRGMDYLGSKMRLKGYDQYYMLLSMEPATTQTIVLPSERPVVLYDLRDGTRLPQHCVRNDDGVGYQTTCHVPLPDYGYTVVGARVCPEAEKMLWKEGYRIANDRFTLQAEGQGLVLSDGTHRWQISLDDFRIRALADMNDGRGDDEWRDAQPHGEPRVSICTDGLSPQMRIDWQADWLLHLRAELTLLDDRLEADLTFVFPHPTLVRKRGESRFSFDPEGLDLLISNGEPCTVGYDIPFGISLYDKPGIGYFCALSSFFVENEGHGLMIAPTTGEQAFSVDTETGLTKLYLGASTTSGPIRNVGLNFRTPTDVDHEPAWYAEPFHGEYLHSITFMPYVGNWHDCHLPSSMQEAHAPVYVRPLLGNRRGKMPASQSFLSYDAKNLRLTKLECEGDSVALRFCEREGRQSPFTLQLLGNESTCEISPFGILSVSQTTTTAKSSR